MSCPRGCCASYREHLTGLSIRTGPSAKTVAEARLTNDLAAYKRLRADGLEPKSFQNAGLLEQNAEIKQEVEQGILLGNSRMRAEVAAAHAEAVVTPIGADMGGTAA